MTHAPGAANPRRPASTKPPAERLGLGEFSPRWWGWLAAVLAYAAFAQVLMISDAWRLNPLARVPLADADVYWADAGRIASGRLLDSTPFMSAPLYPYVLGVVRALGGGLLAVYALQAAMHVSTIGLLAITASRRFGAAVGLLAAVLYALLLEPAWYAGRVLNGSLQLLLIVMLWWALDRASQQHRVRAWCLAGVLLGLCCLANPPMLLALPLLGFWVPWTGQRGNRQWKGALAFVATALLAIAPATIHNFIVCRELIPISGQAGITFAHGNNPAGDGTYAPVAGVSTDRRQQNQDARRIVEQAEQRPATWADVNRYFFHVGLDALRAKPLAGAALWLRKLYWFVSGKHYGDVYTPTLEREAGLAPRMWTTPVPLAWCLPATLLMAVRLMRQPRRHATDVLLAALPLITVVVFYYSPRYRLPIAPIAATLAAVAISSIGAWRTDRRAAAWSAGGIVVGLLLGPTNRLIGFDRPEFVRASFELSLGSACEQLNQTDAALAHFGKALELRPGFTPAADALGRALLRAGRPGEAFPYLSQTCNRADATADDWGRLGRAADAAGRGEGAIMAFTRAAQLDPSSWERHYNLASVLYKAGRLDAALIEYDAAAQANPSHAWTYVGIGMIQLTRGAWRDAELWFREAIRLDSNIAPAHVGLAQALSAQGQDDAALAEAERARALAPQDANVQALLKQLRAKRGAAPPP